MNSAFLRGHKQVPALITEMLAEPSFGFLANCDELGLSYALQAPIAAALWVENFLPQLKNRSHLSLIVHTNDSVGAIHEGIWYQTIPWLLARPEMTISVTLIKQNATNESVEVLWLAPLEEMARTHFASADVVSESLGKNLAREGGADLVMLLHPDFSDAYKSAEVGTVLGLTGKTDRGTLLDAGELERALQAGIPVGVASCEHSLFDEEAWQLSAFGVWVNGEPFENPYCGRGRPYVLSGPPLEWGSVLWAISGDSEFNKPGATHLIVRAARKYQGYKQAYDKSGELFDAWNIGRRVALDWTSTGRSECVVHLPKRRAVRIFDGKIFSVLTDGTLRPTKGHHELAMPLEHLADWPLCPKFSFERVLWAIKAGDILEARYSTSLLEPKPIAWFEGSLKEAALAPRFAKERAELQETLEAVLSRDLERGYMSEDSVLLKILDVVIRYHQGELSSDDELSAAMNAEHIPHELNAALIELATDLLDNEPNDEVGLKILTLLHSQGVPQATVPYARNVFEAFSESEEGARAFAMWQSLVDNTQVAKVVRAQAMHAMGCAYKIAARDYIDVAQAVVCLEKAFELGYYAAGYLLGGYYEEGAHRRPCDDEQPNREKAADYYRMAAFYGDTAAKYKLALFLTKWPDLIEYFGEPENWLNQAASDGDSRAQELLQFGDLSPYQAG